MNSSEILFWKHMGEDLGLEIITPFKLVLPDGAQLKATALVKHSGAKNGMVIDDNYAVLEPHTQTLVDGGYGYCAISSTHAFSK